MGKIERRENIEKAKKGEKIEIKEKEKRRINNRCKRNQWGSIIVNSNKAN